MEYYDFVIYIFLAQFLSNAFFPHSHSKLALIQTFGIFFLGAIARPVGSYFMGVYADRTGRRTSYFQILFLMTLSTLAIALIPTYQMIGFWAIILLIFFRLAQCICFGSDLPTGIILLAEHAPENRKSFYCGLLVMNVAFGSAMGTGISYLLTHFLSASAMQTYGWRLAFLLGAVLNLIGFIARRQIKETSAFMTFKKSLQSVKTFQIGIKDCVIAIGILLFPSSLIMLQTTFPFSLPKTYHISSNNIFLYLTLFGLIEAALIPAFSYLSDFISRRLYYRIGIILWLVIMPLNFIFILPLNNSWSTPLFLALYTLLIGILAGGFFILMAESFSIKARVRQYALSYNIAYLIMSAIPLFVTWLLTMQHWLTGILILTCGLALISLLTTLSPILSHRKIQHRWGSF